MKPSEEKKDNNWKKSGLSNIKDLYRITGRKDSKNMSHINVHLSADIKIFDLSKSDENAVGVGFDFESLDELEIGENVKWYNKKDGQLTGKIIEIQNKKAIIKVDDGRKMKVILKKLKLNSNPRIQEESEGSEGS